MKRSRSHVDSDDDDRKKQKKSRSEKEDEVDKERGNDDRKKQKKSTSKKEDEVDKERDTDDRKKRNKSRSKKEDEVDKERDNDDRKKQKKSRSKNEDGVDKERGNDDRKKQKKNRSTNEDEVDKERDNDARKMQKKSRSKKEDEVDKERDNDDRKKQTKSGSIKEEEVDKERGNDDRKKQKKSRSKKEDEVDKERGNDDREKPKKSRSRNEDEVDKERDNDDRKKQKRSRSKKEDEVDKERGNDDRKDQKKSGSKKEEEVDKERVNDDRKNQKKSRSKKEDEFDKERSNDGRKKQKKSRSKKEDEVDKERGNDDRKKQKKSTSKKEGEVDKERGNDDRKKQKKSTYKKEDKADKERGNNEFVVYRILCPDGFTGTVIRKNGKVKKLIRQVTGANVKLLDPFPGAKDRVITISSYVSNKYEIDVDDEFDDRYPLFPAQDALMKVHEAISNAMAMANENAMASVGNLDRKYKRRDECQLLVPSTQMAYIFGKSGSTISRLRSETRVCINVTPKDPTHSCAVDFDYIIQIIGKAKKVKKALFCVSAILFKFAQKESLSSMLGDLPALQGKLSPLPVTSGSFKSQEGIHSSSNGISIQKDLLMIRVLCPSNAIERVNGNVGSSIESVRHASGARIEVVDAKDNSEDCIITVITTEVRDDVKSMAVDTVLLLQDIISDEDELTVCIHLLVPNEAIHCIIGESDSIVKQIRNQSRAYVRIFQTNKPSRADPDDHLVEIVGEVGCVRDALVDIILRLRGDLLLKDKEAYHNTSTIRSTDLSVQCNHPPRLPSVHPQVLIPSDPVGISQAVNDLVPSGSYSSIIGDFPELQGKISSLPVASGSLRSQNLIIKLLCPSDMIERVIGKGGSSIERVRQASGARVEVNGAKDNPNEYIITVAATEAMNDSDSMGVNAVLMLQGKINEEGDKTVCIHLLVPNYVICCTSGKNGSIAKQICKQTRADVRISETKPSYADPGDLLVEVIGEVASVRHALVLIILRQREYVLLQDKEENHKTSSADLSTPPVYSSHLPLVHSHQPSYPDTATGLVTYLAPMQSLPVNYGYGFMPPMGNNGYGYNTWHSSNPYGGLPQMLVSPMMMGECGSNVDNMHKISGVAVEVSESNPSRSGPLALTSEGGYSVEMIKWSRPPIGNIKINTDGSFSGLAGFGGLARDHDARWIQGFCGKISGCASPLRAELWGIRHGFRLAYKKGWRNAIIETDSGLARDLILRREIISNHPDQDLIDDCIQLIKETGGMLVHVKREGNRCADILARVGINQELEEREIFAPFDELIIALMSDAEGREYPRGS